MIVLVDRIVCLVDFVCSSVDMFVYLLIFVGDILYFEILDFLEVFCVRYFFKFFLVVQGLNLSYSFVFYQVKMIIIQWCCIYRKWKYLYIVFLNRNCTDCLT